MSKLLIGVNGACGRMGQRIVAGVVADPDCELAAALESAQSPNLGRDIGDICGLGPLGVSVTAEPTKPIDGIIDFSVPAATLALAKLCAAQEIPLLVATTGFSPEERAELVEYHHETPLLIASNCSLVVNLLNKLVAEAATVLKGRDFDVEIIERHHRFKVDAPSGTALTFADIISEKMEITGRTYGREGLVGQRPSNEIGIHAVRTGDNVGEHTIVFSTIGETLELVHKGHSRDSYVKGAVAGVKFLAGKKPGLYTMKDVLGL